MDLQQNVSPDDGMQVTFHIVKHQVEVQIIGCFYDFSQTDNVGMVG